MIEIKLKPRDFLTPVSISKNDRKSMLIITHNYLNSLQLIPKKEIPQRDSELELNIFKQNILSQQNHNSLQYIQFIFL